MDNIERDEGSEIEAVEQELRECLRHMPAPEGFTRDVMERVAAREASRARKQGLGLFQGAHRHAGWWTAVAATLLLAVGGDMMHLHRVREEQKAAQAQQQLDLAMQLTNHALDQVDNGMEHTQAARYAQIALALTK